MQDFKNRYAIFKRCYAIVKRCYVRVARGVAIASCWLFSKLIKKDLTAHQIPCYTVTAAPALNPLGFDSWPCNLVRSNKWKAYEGAQSASYWTGP
jgi:hypothetical protein